MANGKVHTVKKGETLKKIARAYKLKDFRQIYDDPANSKFRKQRPDPDDIQPGDKILIPAPAGGVDKKMLTGSLKMLERQIADRDALRKTLIKSEKDAKKRLSDARAGYKKTMTAIEVAETMSSIGISLGKITVNTVKVGKGTLGLAAANKKHMAEMISMHVDATAPAITAAAKKSEDTNTRVGKAVGGSINAYFNLTSPSFYGSRIAVLQQDDFFKKVLSGKFKGTKEDLLKAYSWDFGKEIDASLRELEKQTAGVLAQMKLAEEADKALIAEIRSKL